MPHCCVWGHGRAEWAAGPTAEHRNAQPGPEQQSLLGPRARAWGAPSSLPRQEAALYDPAPLPVRATEIRNSSSPVCTK